VTADRGVHKRCTHQKEKRRFGNPTPRRRARALEGGDDAEATCDQGENAEKASKKPKYWLRLRLVLLRFKTHGRSDAERDTGGVTMSKEKRNDKTQAQNSVVSSV